MGIGLLKHASEDTAEEMAILASQLREMYRQYDIKRGGEHEQERVTYRSYCSTAE